MTRHADIIEIRMLKSHQDFKKYLFEYLDKLILQNKFRCDNINLKTDLNLTTQESIELFLKYIKSKSGCLGSVELIFDLKRIEDSFTLINLNSLGDFKYSAINIYPQNIK